MLLLMFPRLLPFGTLIDLVTARAPVPPAMTGLPTPNLVCISLAFRLRVVGGGVGGGVGSASDGAGSSLSASSAVSGSGATASSSSVSSSSPSSSSSSESDSCTMTELFEGPRDLPLVRRLDALVAEETVLDLGVGAAFVVVGLLLRSVTRRWYETSILTWMHRLVGQ